MKLQYPVSTTTHTDIHHIDCSDPLYDNLNVASSSESSFSGDSESLITLSEQSSDFAATQGGDNKTGKKMTKSIQYVKSNPKPKKSYPCTYCEKVFSRPSALQTHTYTHTAEKPFQCSSPNCGRYFSVVSNLRRHLKVHQKTRSSNKLSSEDRLRCVKELIERSNVILSNMGQKSNGEYFDNCEQIKPLLPRKQLIRDRLYPILPAINSNICQTQHIGKLPYSYLPSLPSRPTPSFYDQPLVGDNDQNSLSSDCLLDALSSWHNQYSQTVPSYFPGLKDHALDSGISLKNDAHTNEFTPPLSYCLCKQVFQGETQATSTDINDYLYDCPTKKL